MRGLLEQPMVVEQPLVYQESFLVSTPSPRLCNGPGMQGQFYATPVDTEMPGDIRTLAGQLGPAWQQMNVTRLMTELDATKRAALVILDSEDNEIAAYEGAIVSSALTEDSFEAHILVEDAVTFILRATGINDEGRASAWSIVVAPHENTMNLILKGQTLLDDCCEAPAVSFRVNDHQIIKASLADNSSEEERRRKSVIDCLTDLRAIAEIRGTSFPVPEHLPDPKGLIALRRVRLALEGHVVWGPQPTAPITLTAPADQVPEVIPLAADTIRLGEVNVDTPPLVLWHPQMQVEELESSGGNAVDTRRFHVSIPKGARFLLWDPERVVTDESGAGWKVTSTDMRSFPELP